MAQLVKKNNNELSKNTLSDLMATKEIQDTISQTLGKQRVQTFIGSALTVAQDPKLLDVEPNSLFNCLLKSATYNFPIDGNLGYAYPVPYKNKDGLKVAVFQMGVKGIIELCYRTNKYKRLNVKDVRKGEITGYDFFGEVQINWILNDRDKQPIVGYMAAFELTNGMTKRVYWEVDKIKEHALKYSKAHQYAVKSKNTSEDLWTQNFSVMAEKTVLKDLLKYAPKSVELINALAFDQSFIKREGGVEKAVYIDNSQQKEPLDTNIVYDIVETQDEPAPCTSIEDDSGILYVDYQTEYKNNQDKYERAPYPDGTDPYNKSTKKIRVRLKEN